MATFAAPSPVLVEGITKMQDMTDYLRDKPIEAERSTVGDSMVDVLHKLYPELSSDDLEARLCEMRGELQSE